MADLFVSYARADRARVAPLVAALEAEGWSVWWDPEITPGEEFDQLIGEQLDKARAVIVVWTPTSVASRWVRGEAREGAERGVLAPVRFEGATLPIDLRSIHTTDLDGWNEDRGSREFGQLARALRRLTSDGAAAEDRAATTVDWVAAKVRRRRWRWIATGASVAVLAVLGFAAWRFMPSAQGPTSIAVERVSAPAGDAPAQMFADRLPGDLATMAQARPTSLKIVQPDASDPPGFVIGGEARTVGDSISSTVNVTSTRDHSIIWSASFTQPIAKAADLPDQAATRLADVLTCAMPRDGGAYGDIEALKQFLAACAIINAPDGTPAKARDQLRAVLARSPGLAKAWALLAMVDTLEPGDVRASAALAA